MNPKSYFACGKGVKTKLAAKGVQNRDKFVYQQFKDVLYGNKHVEVENRIFRPIDGQMSPLYCQKIGLTNVSIKSDVMNDKVTVRPHMKHMQPIKK